MMPKHLGTSCLFIALVCLAGYSRSQTEINSSIVLKVNDKEKIARKLIERAESWDGYFLSRNENNVVIKLSKKHVDAYLKFCDSLGLILSRNYKATDHTLNLSEMQAKIKARRALLEDYFKMLEESEMGSVLIVEKAIVVLQSEIEAQVADLKLLHHKISFAEIKINFQFIERKAPVPTDSSVFNWLNTLNLNDLRRDFQYGLR